MATSPRQSYNPRTDRNHIDELCCDADDRDDLSDWEVDFIADMIRKLERSQTIELSESQYKKLTQIVERDDDFEVW